MLAHHLTQCSLHMGLELATPCFEKGEIVLALAIEAKTLVHQRKAKLVVEESFKRQTSIFPFNSLNAPCIGG